jgi:ATP-dependent HslUV protease subunit HslV
VYALSAARALRRATSLDATTICREAMTVAGELCIYTNTELVIESIPSVGG